MTEITKFSVTGEFITNLARIWFWEEDRPLETCTKLLNCCIQGDNEDAKQIIIRDILEGRKKFEGINKLELVDDNEQIRPLITKFTQKERKAGITKIELEMITNFTKYVDKWSTVKSTHSDVIFNRDLNTYDDWVGWLTTTRGSTFGHEEPITYQDKSENNVNIIDTATKGGCWLIDYPELCYDCCDGDLQQIGSAEFWKNIYKWTKNKPEFESRNQRYEFSMRPKPSFEERMKNLTDMYEEKITENQEPEPEYLSKEWFDYQWQKTKEYKYLMTPDNLERWEGLIAPNGDFYSCEFGSHNAKAYYILVCHADWFNKSQKDIKNNDSIRIDNALDKLLEYGWCATRSVLADNYVLPPFPKNPTRTQCQCILDAINKYHIININCKELYAYMI